MPGQSPRLIPSYQLSSMPTAMRPHLSNVSHCKFPSNQPQQPRVDRASWNPRAFLTSALGIQEGVEKGMWGMG